MKKEFNPIWLIFTLAWGITALIFVIIGGDYDVWAGVFLGSIFGWLTNKRRKEV